MLCTSLSLAGFIYQVRANGHMHACINDRLSLAVTRACLFVRTVPFYFFLPREHPGRLLCAMREKVAGAAKAVSELSE